MVLGKWDSYIQKLYTITKAIYNNYIQKKETLSFSYTIHQDKLKMDERPQSETGFHQNLSENIVTSSTLATATSFKTGLQRQGKQKEK